LTLLKVRLWLVLEYFRNGISGILVLGGENFPVSGREFPVTLLATAFGVSVRAGDEQKVVDPDR